MPQWYCPLPFKHAFVDSTGVSACCNTRRYPVTLDNWATNPNLLALQKQFNNGQVPQQCQPCVHQEQTQGRSLRMDANQDYSNQVYTETDIDFVDYRASNVCNFKCRSCEPIFSHGIDQEAKSNSTLAKFYSKVNNTKTVSITDTNQQWIVDNIQQIKRLMITGGEPTVIPGIKDIIALAVERNPDINILITTNGSFTDKFWYDISIKMPNLHWTLSLDAVGTTAEIVRHGTNWNTVSYNARWLAEHSHSFSINTVVSNLNILHLMPLIKFVNELKPLSNTNGCVHQFHITQRPYMLAADNLDPETKHKAVDHLMRCLELDLDKLQKNMVLGLINKIKNSTFDPALYEKSTEYNSLLDSIRNEDHSTLYL